MVLIKSKLPAVHKKKGPRNKSNALNAVVIVLNAT